ncbi:putative alpha-N-acetylglucosaminidase [Auriculariales sp. MPI-PUGE-AT-0066]|nr:putative alpha-N-acetylglucosaminidase [Auriculariales sp. MPI-PUGE-AT-0066]
MRLLPLFFSGLAACCLSSATVLSEANGTQALLALVKRRLPSALHSSFVFTLDTSDTTAQDTYSVSSVTDGQVGIHGTSTSALSRGLLAYLRTLGGDIYWSSDTFAALPKHLPFLHEPLTATSWAKIRWAFNVVTYSYSMTFYHWNEWEYLIDWCALHGVNFPLAIGGQEFVWRAVYRDFGLADADIYDWFSGPAFQAWQRMGNLHSSWDANLEKRPVTGNWIDAQWDLQLKIVSRMVALGMTPVLPGFAGFIPPALHDVLGGKVLHASQWDTLPVEYTEDTALEAIWPTFATVQEAFVKKQYELYGNWTSHYYALDLWNEMEPSSLELDYLENSTRSVIKSLRAVDSEAVWVMQAWLFVAAPYWNATNIAAVLAGAKKDELLVLDLFSEAVPAWELTSGYNDHQWTWNMLHNFGGGQSMYGDLPHCAIEPLRALQAHPDTLVGLGITMEGINQNEIAYEFMLDVAWSTAALDVAKWVRRYATRRYTLGNHTPAQKTAAALVQQGWSLLRESAYGNPKPNVMGASIHSIFELLPNVTNIDDRTIVLPTIPSYEPVDVVRAFVQFNDAVHKDATLLENAPFAYDYTDLTRQVLVNAFIPQYHALIGAWNMSDVVGIKEASAEMQKLLTDLDDVLATNKNFLLANWVKGAQQVSWSDGSAADAHFFEFNARNQIGVWGPADHVPWALDRYAAKQWHGVVGDLDAKTWSLFAEYLAAHPPSTYNTTEWFYAALEVERAWEKRVWGTQENETWSTVGQIGTVIDKVWASWKPVLEIYYNTTF